jgi:glycine cleavage system H protein
MTRDAVRGDLYHDVETHSWVEPLEGGRVRLGLDPVEAESTGDIVALSFLPEGTRVARGEALGTLEAAKFVGPLLAPVSGVVRGHNRAVLESPGMVNRDPYGAWLVELELEDATQLDGMLRGEAEVGAWLERELERHRRNGAIAR